MWVGLPSAGMVDVDNNVVSDDGDDGFDPANPPPFRLGQLRAAIPKHCWVKNPWRSLTYVVRDFFIIFLLGAAAIYLNRTCLFWFWPFYWLAQGTIFFSLFLIGHDTGHGSFSDSQTLNNVVGHLVHTWILIPYNGWRVSHKIHHNYNGNVDRDEAWVPMLEKDYKNSNPLVRFARYTVPFSLTGFPYYLVFGGLHKNQSHFSPYSKLFRANERRGAAISTAIWIAMVCLLMRTSFAIGHLQLFNLYVIPLMICSCWLGFVTYLNHHGHDNKIPWYRGKEWNYLRGALTTSDLDYGWLLNNIHHDIGTHVVHHFFPSIPHYHLVEATRAVKPLLGKYYIEPEKSGNLPFHLWKLYKRSINRDHYVSDTGEILYYQSDPNLHKVL